MRELFKEKEMASTQKNKESLAEFSGYTSEEYLDDILDFFYSADKYGNNKTFNEVKAIDERSLQKNSKVKFIKEIEKYNFYVIERYILLYLSILKMKRHGTRDKSDVIERIVYKRFVKPSVIIKLLSENSKLFKNKCMRYEKRHPYDESPYMEVDDKIYNILFNSDFKENEKINKENKKERKFNILPNEIYEKLNKYSKFAS